MAIDMKFIGTRLRELRTASTLSQSNIAEYLQVDQSLIAKYESGERTISTDTLDKLSALFCCPVSTILSSGTCSESIEFAFRTTHLNEKDLIALAEINRIALNQMEMDEITEDGNA